MELKQLVEKEFKKWEEDESQLWEANDVKDFAIAIAGNVVACCILLATYPKLDDEQSYYGNLCCTYCQCFILGSSPEACIKAWNHRKNIA